MKTLRNNKLQFYTTHQTKEQLNHAAADLHRSVGSLYEDAIAKMSEAQEIPETYFSLNGGQGVAQTQVNVTKEAYDKVVRIAEARQSLTGRVGTKTAIMRWLGDDILSRFSRGEYERKKVGPGCIQIVVAETMHKKMQELFPRKFIPEKEEWSGGISKHIRAIIRSLKVEDFPKERVQQIYREFVAETSGLHPYTQENKQALLKQNLRPYAVSMHEKEHAILDAIGRGGYGTKAALCYYAYKQAYEKATQREADKQTLKRTAESDAIPHACGMEIPKEEKVQKSPEKAQKELKKDLNILKIDVTALKNTQKQLIWAIKRLNERVFSKRKRFWWFHVLVIWTIATVLITLGVVSLIN